MTVIDPEALPAVFPVQTASRVLGIGRNQTYELVKAGRYPVRVLEIGGRFKVSRYDLLAYLGAGQAQTARGHRDRRDDACEPHPVREHLAQALRAADHRPVSPIKDGAQALTCVDDSTPATPQVSGQILLPGTGCARHPGGCKCQPMARQRLDPEHPKAVLFSTKLGVPDAEKVIELANAAGTTRSEFVRQAVADAIERAEGRDDG
jgi:Ribbon-helix-helix protein, copG family